MVCVSQIKAPGSPSTYFNEKVSGFSLDVKYFYIKLHNPMIREK